MCTYNYMHFGAHKIWYMVPKRHGTRFQSFVKDKNLLNILIAKTYFLKSFGVAGMAVTEDDVSRINNN